MFYYLQRKISEDLPTPHLQQQRRSFSVNSEHVASLSGCRQLVEEEAAVAAVRVANVMRFNVCFMSTEFTCWRLRHDRTCLRIWN